MQQDFSGIHQGIGTVKRSRAHMQKRTLHVFPTFSMAIEQTQIQPCRSAAMTGIDRLLVLVLGRGEIAFLFGEAGIHPVSSGRIESKQRFSLVYSLVATSTNYSWSLQIKLCQVTASVHVVGIQPLCRLELASNMACQTRGSHPSGAVSFLPIGPAQPEMILAIFRSK